MPPSHVQELHKLDAYLCASCRAADAAARALSAPSHPGRPPAALANPLPSAGPSAVAAALAAGALAPPEASPPAPRGGAATATTVAAGGGGVPVPGTEGWAVSPEALAHPALPAMLGLAPVAQLLPSPALDDVGAPGGWRGGGGGAAAVVGVPAPVRLMLQQLLQGELRAPYAEVPRAVVAAAAGPRLSRSGPWTLRSAALPALRAAAACNALDAAPRAGAGAEGEESRAAVVQEEGPPGGRGGAEGEAVTVAAGAAGRAEEVVLVSCWVPTPVEGLMPWRRGVLL